MDKVILKLERAFNSTNLKESKRPTNSALKDLRESDRDSYGKALKILTDAKEGQGSPIMRVIDMLKEAEADANETYRQNADIGKIIYAAEAMTKELEFVGQYKLGTEEFLSNLSTVYNYYKNNKDSNTLPGLKDFMEYFTSKTSDKCITFHLNDIIRNKTRIGRDYSPVCEVYSPIIIKDEGSEPYIGPFVLGDTTYWSLVYFQGGEFNFDSSTLKSHDYERIINDTFIEDDLQYFHNILFHEDMIILKVAEIYDKWRDQARSYASKIARISNTSETAKSSDVIKESVNGMSYGELRDVINSFLLDTEYGEAFAAAVMDLGYIPDGLTPAKMYYDYPEEYAELEQRHLSDDEIKNIIGHMINSMKNDFQFGKFFQYLLDHFKRYLPDEYANKYIEYVIKDL